MLKIRGRSRDENRILGILNDDQKQKNGIRTVLIIKGTS